MAISGVVRRGEQRGNPQAAWSVYRKDDAIALTAWLRRYPLRSRKRLDLQVWCAAVQHWSASGGAGRSKSTELRAALRAGRAYHDGGHAADSRVIRSRGFHDWLGGFIAGDGHLGIHRGATLLTVKLRADDAPLLAAIRETMGMGTICGPYPNARAHPSVAWNVCRTSELLALIELLDGRIPGRKAAEFDVWRRAVTARADRACRRRIG
jgi:hypothetical protein